MHIQALIPKKRVQPILQNRTAESGAELVALELRQIRGQIERPRVQLLIAQELPRGPVKAVAARLSNYIYRSSSVLRWNHSRLNLKFRDAVNRRRVIQSVVVGIDVRGAIER